MRFSQTMQLTLPLKQPPQRLWRPVLIGRELASHYWKESDQCSPTGESWQKRGMVKEQVWMAHRTGRHWRVCSVLTFKVSVIVVWPQSLTNWIQTHSVRATCECDIRNYFSNETCGQRIDDWAVPFRQWWQHPSLTVTLGHCTRKRQTSSVQSAPFTALSWIMSRPPTNIMHTTVPLQLHLVTGDQMLQVRV